MGSETEKKSDNETCKAHNNDNPTRKFCWWHNPSERFTFFVAIFTGLLVVVGGLQWCILKETDETSRLRDRAFVYFYTPTFTPYPSRENPSQYIFILALQNSGNMPALSFDLRYADIGSPVETNVAPVAEAKWIKVDTGKSLGPKQIFNFQLFKAERITVDEFKIMQESGSIGKFILAEATYLDGFSQKQRVTRMGVRLNIDRTGAHSFTFTSNHNCTDDDCH